jgi:hypothetical protein
MSLTELQRTVCRLLAQRRIDDGEQYVAGGLALNTALGGWRISRDLDLFHDTDEALATSVLADQETLRQAGYELEAGREAKGFVETTIRQGSEALEIQWVRDSAFRFFPLVMHPDLGLSLHPYDLATNKVLALVGRVAARDWIDILTCHERLSAFGCLAWAASGKDPGLGPLFIVDEAARTARYSAVEFEALQFAELAPDREALGRIWRAAVKDARTIVDILPPDEIGQAVLDETGAPFVGEAAALSRALDAGKIRFHRGAIRGAVPTIAPR